MECQITEAGRFDEVFGMATTMGEEGKPTAVDFSSQYVIAVVLPVTSEAVSLEPVKLIKRGNGEMEFSYRIKNGGKQSYSIRPFLAVAVDTAFVAPVLLTEIID